jgi:predicted phage terminase large subunit-like protein
MFDLEDIDLDPEVVYQLPLSEKIELAKAVDALRLIRSKRRCEESLAEFTRQAWTVIEPSQPYTHGWHIDAICMHLEAITDGDINRLLVNVPPGTMKSLLTNVFWPAWEWGPKGMPSTRYLCTAHSQNLAIRDSTKMRRLIQSDWYQKRWGDTVKLTGDQNAKTKFENTATGFREAAAFQSLTGVRADRVIIDDPHSVDGALSEVQRESTITSFLEAVPTRLSNPDSSAIVVIMQRLHEGDVSGVILEKNLGYVHLCLPMRFEPDRKCYTELGFEDPREDDGELLFPARFPLAVVERDEAVMGVYASAGQFQQRPSPRGGGIWKRSDWVLYDNEMAQTFGKPDANKYPDCDYIIASLDPAYTERSENDPSGFVIFGVCQRGGATARRILSQRGEISEVLDDRDTLPNVILMYAWSKRLPIHGPDVLREPGESDTSFAMRKKAAMGLVEHVIDSCTRYSVDMLLVEAKGPGISVAQEIQRLNRTASWGVQLVNPGPSDKLARAYSVQPIFTSGMVIAPDKTWADDTITECEQFPKGKHDDRVDAISQALRYLRERGMLRRPEEIAAEIQREATYQAPTRAVYDV